VLVLRLDVVPLPSVTAVPSFDSVPQFGHLESLPFVPVLIAQLVLLPAAVPPRNQYSTGCLAAVLQNEKDFAVWPLYPPIEKDFAVIVIAAREIQTKKKEKTTTVFEN
jgi:hypothetical protein